MPSVPDFGPRSASPRIVLEPEYCSAEAVRGLEEFSWVWLVWAFSANAGRWSPTVRSPRLGGSRRLGVFATRSPFRPNPVGLSSVRLEGLVTDPQLGPVLEVSGADLLDGTPILDIKPYVEADNHPNAARGFAALNSDYQLEVVIPTELAEQLPAGQEEALRGVLAQDRAPRTRTTRTPSTAWRTPGSTYASPSRTACSPSAKWGDMPADRAA